MLDWTNATATYAARYNWERGSYIDESVTLGNTIKNQREISLQAGLNLQQLYNKSHYLKKVNQKTSAPTGDANASRNAPRSREEKKKEVIKFETTVTLNPDTGVIVATN